MSDLALTLPDRQVLDAVHMNGSLLDAAQAGALLNVPASWVLAEARADRIPHVRLGRYVRFDRDQLVAWRQTRTRGPQPRPITTPTERDHHE